MGCNDWEKDAAQLHVKRNCLHSWTIEQFWCRLLTYG